MFNVMLTTELVQITRIEVQSVMEVEEEKRKHMYLATRDAGKPLII